VKYVKRNFFAGRRGEDVADVAVALQKWVDEIANVRVHGTTHRRPIDVYASEREAMLPLPDRRFELVTWHQARVHQDSHVAYDRRLYSVPWRLIGQYVWLRVTATTIVVYADDVRVAMHDRRGHATRSTHDEHLPEDRAPWRHRSRAYWEGRADRIAAEVGVYIRAVFDSDDVLSMLRTVQAMVTHLEKFPTSRTIAACQRAQHFGSHQYRTIKNILRDGLDLVPLATPTSSALHAPRFARSVSELLHRTKDDDHEHN
jgi:hypothetical protein